jgi:hypothetical protein
MRRRLFLVFLASMWIGGELPAQEPVCALSDKQERDAPLAFENLMPLFMTKRCLNCHGGLSPFVGVKMGDQFMPLTPRGTHPVLSKDEGSIVLNSEGTENLTKTFEGCVTCHDAGAFQAGTWRLAPTLPNKRFTIGPGDIPKSSLDICRQVKIQGRVPGAAGFIGHMTDDNGDTTSPFLETAFAGTMALDDNEKDSAADILKNEGGYPGPITVMTRGQALQLSKDWIAAMGGKFRQPEVCGCKELHYALRLSAYGRLQMPGFTFNVRFSGQGTFLPEIPLKFEDNGTLSGEVMATPMTDNQGSLPLVSCTGERNNEIKMVVQGSWEDITAASHEPTSAPPSPPQHPIIVKLTFSQIQTVAREMCSTPLGTMLGSSDKTGPLQYPFELVFTDPHVTQTVTVDWPAAFPGWSGTVRAEIIQLK